MWKISSHLCSSASKEKSTVIPLRARSFARSLALTTRALCVRACVSVRAARRACICGLVCERAHAHTLKSVRGARLLCVRAVRKSVQWRTKGGLCFAH